MSKGPEGLPEQAKYSDAYKLWGVGEEKYGARDGVWRWYSGDSPDHPVFEQTYSTGELQSSQTFYPDGKVKSRSTYSENKVIDFSFFVEREHDWTRNLSSFVTLRHDSVPENAFEIRKIPHTYPLSYEFFDTQGQKLNALGLPDAEAASFTKTAQKLARKKKNETASRAITRYQAFYDALCGLMGADPADPSPSRVLARYRLEFIATPVAVGDLDAAQSRLGVDLPASYRDFVTERGLFRFGPGDESRLLAPDDLTSVLEYLQSDADLNLQEIRDHWELDDDAVQRLGCSIAFSMGDAALQICYFHCFRFDAPGDEVPIWDFDHHTPGDFAARAGAGSGPSFDEHIAGLVSRKIREFIKEMKSPTY